MTRKKQRHWLRKRKKQYKKTIKRGEKWGSGEKKGRMEKGGENALKNHGKNKRKKER
jgi:hypothetical protein